MNTISFSNAFKSLMATLGAKTTDSNYAVPLVNKTSGAPQGFMDMSSLMNVLGVVMMGKSATRLVNGDDCNNCNRQGVWIKHSDASSITVSNSPFGDSSAFVLWYLSPYQDDASLTKYGVQMAFGYSGIKARKVQNGNWGEWTTIL